MRRAPSASIPDQDIQRERGGDDYRDWFLGRRALKMWTRLTRQGGSSGYFYVRVLSYVRKELTTLKNRLKSLKLTRVRGRSGGRSDIDGKVSAGKLRD